MIASGFYKHSIGGIYNIIGVSENTEGGAKVVILQEFGSGHKGRLLYVALDQFKDKWRAKLALLKPQDPPRIQGAPPMLHDWLPPGLYQHFKGGRYNCIGVSVSTDDADELVMVYQSLYGDRIFQLAHRPYDMFREHVEKPEHQYSGPRFKLIRAYAAPTIAGTQRK